MTTYENAPATRLLATRCACCGRKLVDALSVQTGIGPECRTRHGYDNAPNPPDWNAARTFIANFGKDVSVADPTVLTSDNARHVCNVLVHRFAGNFRTARWIPDCIYALGYVKLSERLAKRAHVHLGAPRTPEMVHVTKEVYTDSFKGRTQTREVYVVRAPFCPSFNNAHVPGRWFDRDIKAWRVPVASRVPLWSALQANFKGLPLVTGNGSTTVIS